jgi:hypothetical protein
MKNSDSELEKQYQLIVEKIFEEAEPIASEQLVKFIELFEINIEFSSDSILAVALRARDTEYTKYDKELHIKELKQSKAKILQSIKLSNDIYDSENNLHLDRYDIHRQRVVEQLLILKKIEYLNKVIDDNQVPKSICPGKRIKWLRSVSEFGHMMLLLESKGYIELPSAGNNPEGSYEMFAKILNHCFDVTDSYPSLKDALNPNRNRLSDTKSNKLSDFPFDIPDSSDLGGLKKKKSKPIR